MYTTAILAARSPSATHDTPASASHVIIARATFGERHHTLLRVAEKGLYRPLWFGRILAEAEAAIEEIHPGIDAAKRFAQMREAFDDALGLRLGRTRMRPVPARPGRQSCVAAAIRGGAQAIITADAKDFPTTALAPLGLEAVHPDDFLLDQLDLSPPTILQVIREQAARTRRPPLTPRDLATLLGRAGVPGFAGELLRRMASPSTAPDGRGTT